MNPPHHHDIPGSWEETEWRQRIQARIIVGFFALIITGSVTYSLYIRDWKSLLWWGEIVGGVFVGVLVWSACVWVFARVLGLGITWMQKLVEKRAGE